MPWNPEKYNQFKAVRYQPFFDLLAQISQTGLKTGVDIGCGTGEQTALLSEKFPETTFLGIDASAEMLAESRKYASDRLGFRQSTIEAFMDENSAWDLIFSNAALQWVDDHTILFSRMIAKLNPGGQFAVQMPVQNANLLNMLLIELAGEKPYADYLNRWKRESPMLSIDQYAELLFEAGLENIRISQVVYPIIARDEVELYDFIAGTALIPYLERLQESEKDLFIAEYKNRIRRSFKKFPAIYAFKRLLLYGQKK